MLDLLFTNPFAFIVVFGGIILAIGIHEAAHCYMADYLGDPTPEAMGRKTLNPSSPPSLLELNDFGAGGFGWGKPPPTIPTIWLIPPDTKLIALAGPFSNVLILLFYR